MSYKKFIKDFWVKSSLFVAILFTMGNVVIAQDGVVSEETQETEKTEATSSTGLSTDAAVIDKGKSLFSGNCQQCHNVHKKVVGPMLSGVYERQNINWLIGFIKYPEKTIKSGDAHAVELYNEYKQIMPNHDFLTDQDVMAILAYIQDETIKGPANNVVVGGDNSTASVKEDNTGFLTAALFVLSGILLLAIGALAMLASVLKNNLSKRDDLNEQAQDILSHKFTFKKLFQSTGVVALLVFLFIGIAGKGLLTGLFNIGLQQGYAPDQPIPFSHKLHAGFYEIDCKYCHTGVEKSKNANIPSPNICMNCHNTIRTTAPNIQKLYSYIENNEPIQWVRVHNLPDLAYFNHSQHVKVGGIECETCHGDIKNMEVVQQHSLLTMGWCIDCHRKTDVNSKGNAYYDKLVEMHDKSTKKPMKVEDIGGLECAKCHY